MKLTEQQLEEMGVDSWNIWQWKCDPDVEYDNMRADGYRMHHEKRLSEEAERRELNPESWGNIVSDLTKRHL